MAGSGMAGSSPRVRGKRDRRPTGRLEAGLIPARAGKTVCVPVVRDDVEAHPRACGENMTATTAMNHHRGSSPRVRGKLLRLLRAGRALGLIPARAGKTPAGGPAGGGAPAHPRACGENAVVRMVGDPMQGSSPRVRGKRVRGRRGRSVGGLIPARAGKTDVHCPVLSMCWAHPRACGENIEKVTLDESDKGSSPRVRGKPPPTPGLWPGRGLIPACAGKTTSNHWRARSSPAHPRVCGENRRAFSHRLKREGSSPRVRGKRLALVEPVHPGRLIPACAGKTPGSSKSPHEASAHPRVCGENVREVSLTAIPAGSSPRVRGKLFAVFCEVFTIGLIPACAGKTRGRHRGRRSQAAHPRVCGENGGSGAGVEVGDGSSPRVRGKHNVTPGGGEDARLIPACAGKTLGTARTGRPTPAHPRVCGENNANVDPLTALVGSSPRVRGKRRIHVREPQGVRLIPACAGKT